MKIRELHIDRFGCFRDHTREFAPGFVMIGARNEAGKTTLLEFMRRLFFGFPDGRHAGNRYLLPGEKDSAEFGGSATLELDSGEVIRIERHRGNGKLRLTAADGRVNEAADEEFLRLTGLSGEWYNRIYAITLDELASLSALENDEIRRRFYGAPLAAAGVSPSRLSREFEAAEKELFKARGANSEFGRLREEFAAAEEELRAAEEAQPRAEAAHRRAEAAELAARQAEAKRRKLADDCRRAEEELERLTLLRETEEAAARFARLAPLPEVPGDWKSLRAERCAALRAAEAECAADPEIPADAPEIDEELFRRADEVLRDTLAAARPGAPPVAASALLFIGIALIGAALLIPWLPLLFPAAAGVAVGGWMLLRRSRKRVRESARAAAAAEEFRRHCGLVAADPADFGAELRAMQALRLRRRRLDDARRALAEFDASLGVDGDAGFAALLERREEYLRARAAAERSRAVLERLAGGAEELPALRLRFAGVEAETLRRGIAELRREETECDRLFAQATRNAEAAKAEARSLGGRDPAVPATRLDGLRGEIRETLRRLLTLHGARRLLDLAITRYENESQPEVIRRAAGDFIAFTGGRYTRCFRSVGTGELTVTDGETKLDKTFEILSRGTREQLMLAMRLALIEMREAGGAESMPVILDDIGVNFDPERRRAVVARLREFAAGRQLFFFSHDEAF